MANKNYDDMSDKEVRIIGVDQNKPKGYFCRAFAATCPYFKNIGLCTQGDCVHADERIPSDDEMLRLQLMQMRRTQLNMVWESYRDKVQVPWYKPKTR